VLGNLATACWPWQRWPCSGLMQSGRKRRRLD